MRRRPHHSLAAALAVGGFLAAYVVCWTVVLTREARPAATLVPSPFTGEGDHAQHGGGGEPPSSGFAVPRKRGESRAAVRLPPADSRLPLLFVHDAPSGWAYPVECCSNLDCREVADADVREGPDGYVIPATGEVVPYGDARVKDSPDGRFHWCALGDGLSRPRETSTICLFVPPRGF